MLAPPTATSPETDQVAQPVPLPAVTAQDTEETTPVQSPPELSKSPTPSVSSASSAKLTGPKRAAPPRKKRPTPTPSKEEEVIPAPVAEDVELPPSRKTTEEQTDVDPEHVQLPPSRKPTEDEHSLLEVEDPKTTDVSPSPSGITLPASRMTSMYEDDEGALASVYM